MKKCKKVLVWILAFVVVVGLLGANVIVSILIPFAPATTREIAMSCTTESATRYHIHAHITITANGAAQEIPANIGIAPTCLHPIHTHDASGTIHVESPEARDFTLGDFFAVWQEQFSANQILDFSRDTSHEIVMAVDDKENKEFQNLVLEDDQQIIIEYKKVASPK